MPLTDVDRLILDRWTEVTALRRAFDELIERMHEPIEIASHRAVRRCQEMGMSADFESKYPSLDLWKETWATRQGSAEIYLRIGGFAPREYCESDCAHPWLWVMMAERVSIFRQADRGPFIRDLRTHLGSDAARWEHPEVDDAIQPLGRYCTDISEADRIRWMSHPDELVEFLSKGIEELMTLAPTIDAVLDKYRRR